MYDLISLVETQWAEHVRELKPEEQVWGAKTGGAGAGAGTGGAGAGVAIGGYINSGPQVLFCGCGQFLLISLRSKQQRTSTNFMPLQCNSGSPILGASWFLKQFVSIFFWLGYTPLSSNTFFTSQLLCKKSPCL